MTILIKNHKNRDMIDEWIENIGIGFMSGSVVAYVMSDQSNLIQFLIFSITGSLLLLIGGLDRNKRNVD